MTWIDNNGDVRPQSWEEYLAMKEHVPAWALPLQTVYQPLHMKPQRRHDDREGVPRIRQRLFRADPHCFWCGCLTRYGAHGNPKQSTVDHLYSRLHPHRIARYREQKGVLHVLACAACNNERGVCEQQRRPFIPKLPERLQYAKLADATLASATEGKIPSSSSRPIRVIQKLEEAVGYARDNPVR